MVDVVTLGETMVLFQPSSQGKITDAQYFLKTIGGAESNVALALARLNHPVRWISKLGEDPFRDLILKTLQGEGVETDDVMIDADNPTAVFFKEDRRRSEQHMSEFRSRAAVIYGLHIENNNVYVAAFCN